MSRVIVVDVDDGDLFATTDSNLDEGDRFETILVVDEEAQVVKGEVATVVEYEYEVGENDLEDAIKAHKMLNGGDSA